MSVQDEFTYELREGVGIITLNRPKQMNAITWDLSGAVAALLRDDDRVDV